MTSATPTWDTEAPPAAEDRDQTGAEEEARRFAQSGKTWQFIEQLVERVGGDASAKAVFAEPIEREGLTVVPVARVRWGVGGGSGSGPADQAGQAMGSGSGGMGGVTADPVGYLEVSGGGAKFRTIPQLPSAGFVLASGITAGIVLRALSRFVRH
jgi:uncharacterized spore protein YtfJ